MDKQIEKNGYDVLIYMSDQHTADTAGFMGDEIVRTPNLDKLAEESYVFDNAYTSCPLCVPARASFMTARLPSNIGVFDNGSDFKSSEVTFAHTHAASGYDATLIGRMHFVGLDYLHGFTQRIGLDMTPSYWGCASEDREDLGDFGRSLYQKWCLEVIGSGDSPVSAYDRLVVDDALEFLSHDYEKPQLTVVGTYAPHFPYMGDEKKMAYYRDKLKAVYHDEHVEFNLPPVEAKIQKASKEDIIELRAAYYAMVETMDEQIGLVYAAFRKYLERNGRKGVFIYMSDHGDQLGCMEIYGKQTFFEKSARIPLLMKIDGMGNGRIEPPVSIMEVGSTLNELNGVDRIPLEEGKSFLPLIKGESDDSRYVISEFYDGQIRDCVRGYMVVGGGFKYIEYSGWDDKPMLFNLNESRDERVNVASLYPEVVEKMKNLLHSDSRVKDLSKDYLDLRKNQKLLGKTGRNQPYLNKYLFSPPVSARYADPGCKRAKRS